MVGAFTRQGHGKGIGAIRRRFFRAEARAVVDVDEPQLAALLAGSHDSCGGRVAVRASLRINRASVSASR
jgi:hypothetical protein